MGRAADEDWRQKRSTFISQSRTSVPRTLTRIEVAQPLRLLKKKNKAMLPKNAATTRPCGR
jgi:hypothetical protein